MTQLPPPPLPPPNVRVIHCGDLANTNDMNMHATENGTIGPVNNNINNTEKLFAVFNKVSALHRSPKAGPFDAVLLVSSEYRSGGDGSSSSSSSSGDGSQCLSADCVDKAITRLYKELSAHSNGSQQQSLDW